MESAEKFLIFLSNVRLYSMVFIENGVRRKIRCCDKTLFQWFMAFKSSVDQRSLIKNKQPQMKVFCLNHMHIFYSYIAYH